MGFCLRNNALVLLFVLRQFTYSGTALFRNETVGSLQGWIGVTFDDDKRIKKVSFTHSYIVPKEDAILEFQEFAELINSKYNLRWDISEDHVYTYESEKDDVIFCLDWESDRIFVGH